MSQARRPLRSDVELPVPAQGSPLDFLLVQLQAQRGDDCVPALAKLFRQIVLADNYVPGWEALMDIAPVGRNFVSESAQLFLPVTLRTLGSGFIGLETPSARSCNSDSTSDHRAGSPV